MGDDAGAAWSLVPSKVKTWPFFAAAAAQYSEEAARPQDSFIVAASDGVGMRAAAAMMHFAVVSRSFQLRPCVERRSPALIRRYPSTTAQPYEPRRTTY